MVGTMSRKRAKHFFVLGVDPGNVAGASLLEVYGTQITLMGLWRRGTQKEPCNGNDIWDVVLDAYALTQGNCIVGVEDQFLPGSAGKFGAKRAHGVSALVTASRAGGWKAIAQISGWHVWGESLKPNTWRQVVYGKHKIKKTEVYKKWAVDKVHELFDMEGMEAFTHHEAEGCLIGYHVCKQVLMFGVKGAA